MFLLFLRVRKSFLLLLKSSFGILSYLGHILSKFELRRFTKQTPTLVEIGYQCKSEEKTDFSGRLLKFSQGFENHKRTWYFKSSKCDFYKPVEEEMYLLTPKFHWSMNVGSE